jgi:RHS repeat-associated protein
VNAAVSIFLTLLIFLAGGSFAAGMASTEASSTAVLTSYVYDKAHNRTSRTIAGVATASVFGNGNNGANSNQLISYGAGTSFTYDLNGNRATKVTAAGTENYTWSYENQLTALSKPGVGSYKYQYDHRARRVTRDESLAGGLKTLISFSGGSSVQERTVAGVLITELIRGSDWGGGVGGLLYSIRSGARSYNAYNSRGDVVSTTADNGSATWQASYQALGKRTAEQGSNAERQRANTKEEDPTGLLNEGHRYRDLETGEFISRDPMGFIDGPNVYAYTRQNPWSGFDPEGLSVWSDTVGYWKGVGNGAGNMVAGVATMAWDAHPVVNGGQYLMGQQTGYQRSFEGGVAMAKAATNLATSSQARSDAVGAVGNHLNEAWNNPEKAGELAFNAVTTAVTLGEAGVAIASKVKAGASLAASARVTAGAAEAEVVAAEVAGGVKSVTTPVGELRSAKLRDAHHVIQDAAVRDLPGYNTNAAPGIQLEGPANVKGTPHQMTRPVQRQSGGGTYAAERRIGYKALRRAGVSVLDSRQAISEADNFFKAIDVKPQTSTRIPGDRR